MSQRKSGYARKKNDLYETPSWVVDALIPHIPKRINTIWEPACGSGAIQCVLNTVWRDGVGRYHVRATDLANDFMTHPGFPDVDAVITNPPFKLANKFIIKALAITEQRHGFAAFLLRTDFDHAISRISFFKHPFAKKVVLTKRIRWFPDSKGSPSFNHAWFCWDWLHQGDPVIAYATP